ncbi:MAG TPA: VOC family protein [Pyrinomonadaceae bacterium]|nr:VOC family protein [Pyrinomonadaceae bacterium]
MFRIKAIDHVVIRTLDLERMIQFYRDVLGCALERRRDDLGLVHMRAGSSLIDLVSVAGNRRSDADVPAAEGRNMEHLCLRIEPFDYQELSDHFRALGVTIGKEERHYGAEGEGASVYLNDPEGNTIELKASAVRPAAERVEN